jgi:DNA invertase Pin-like site-specific DNA recombinase
MTLKSKMFIRAYLRASTSEQNASRAKETLKAFALESKKRIAGFYIENASGNTINRPELLRLLEESEKNDVLLVESIDRLTRLNPENWDILSSAIRNKGIHIVSLDLPTSHIALNEKYEEDFMDSVLKAINTMLLDILAAVSYKEYVERERKQKEGIAIAKTLGKFNGKKADVHMHNKIIALTNTKKFSINQIVDMTGSSRSTVIRVRRNLIKTQDIDE